MTPKTSYVARLLETARSQIGVSEASRKNDGTPSTRYMGGRKEPWCAWFVLYCFRNAEKPLPGDPGKPVGQACAMASVKYMHGVFKSKGWLVEKPLPGDVVFFDTRMGSDAGPGYHVGVVEVVNEAGLHVIEGNTSDKVQRIVYTPAKLKKTVLGYGRVPV